MTFPTATDAQLRAYLRRIEFASELRADLATLNALHLAHATHIPFENIDVLLRRPIQLDLESLSAKLVQRRRGGYCFEHNLLFAAMLEKAGFHVSRLAARVRYGSDAVRPRTHMLLLVDLDGARWLADVGFGAEGLLLPVPMTDAPTRQFAWTYRVAEQSSSLTLQSLRPSGWTDLYAFTLEPQQLPDFEMANYFVSTHPDSQFVRTLTAQLPAPAVRYALRGRVLTEDRGGTLTTRTLDTDHELAAVLSQTFGMELPPGLQFPELIAAIEASSLLSAEWHSMRETFGDEELARLVRVSKASLLRYAGGERGTPDDVADRLHWLAMVVADLAASYNDAGIRRWFHRPRTPLGGKTPAQTLHGRWSSDSDGAKRVRELARSLTAAGAT